MRRRYFTRLANDIRWNYQLGWFFELLSQRFGARIPYITRILTEAVTDNWMVFVRHKRHMDKLGTWVGATIVNDDPHWEEA